MDTSKTELHGNIAALYFKTKNWTKVIEEYNIKLQKTGTLTPREYFDLGRAYYFNKSFVELILPSLCWLKLNRIWQQVTCLEQELMQAWIPHLKKGLLNK